MHSRIFMFVLAVLTVFAQFTQGQTLPSYIHACARHDPNLNECAKEGANFALPYVLKGDSSIKLETLLPYSLPNVEIKTAGDLKFKFTDSKLFGLETLHVEAANFELDKGHIQFKGKLGFATLVGNYIIDGHIMVLPITGSGFSNITLENVEYDYHLQFELVTRDGKEYISTKTSKLELVAEVSRYRFDNLFNGDKVLGVEMNKFLNDNHKDVGKDLNPLIAEVFSQIITHILKVFIEKTPFDVLFS